VSTCRDAFGCPVEIEFAVDWSEHHQEPLFALLQVRPFITRAGLEMVVSAPESVVTHGATRSEPWAMVSSTTCVDIVYVPPRLFDKARTREIAEQVGGVNRKLVDQKRPYILLGLDDGVVRLRGLDRRSWAQISGASVLVEAGLADFNIDPSQGTHFFQNMTIGGNGILVYSLRC